MQLAIATFLIDEDIASPEMIEERMRQMQDKVINSVFDEPMRSRLITWFKENNS